MGCIYSHERCSTLAALGTALATVAAVAAFHAAGTSLVNGDLDSRGHCDCELVVNGSLSVAC